MADELFKQQNLQLERIADALEALVAIHGHSEGVVSAADAQPPTPFKSGDRFHRNGYPDSTGTVIQTVLGEPDVLIVTFDGRQTTDFVYVDSLCKIEGER